jgi:putative ABC transport system permease protein
MDDDLRQEIETHLALLEEEERGRSGDAAEAGRRARSRFGSPLHYRERALDAVIATSLEHAVRDVRYAVRTLLRAPGFTAATILMLAIGMGAATTVYSYLRVLLTATAPPVDLERRVAVWSQNRAQADPKGLVSLHDFAAWRTHAQSFAAIAASTDLALNLGAIDEPVRLGARAVTASYFDLIGVRLARGRTFAEDDSQPGADPVAILGYREWRDRLDGDPGVIGRTVLLDGVRTTIVGVLGEWELQPQVLVPLTIDLSHVDRSARTLFVAATLRAGVTRDQAAAEMIDIARQLEAEHPGSNRGWSVYLSPLAEEFIGRQARVAIGVLAAIVVAVLLIACANVANLTLARGLARYREIAVRSALGAGTGQIVRQLLVEGFILSAVAAGLGLVIARWGLQWLQVRFATGPALSERFRLDPNVFVFAAGLSMAATLLFGLVPALRTASTDVVSGLHQSTNRTTGGRASRLFRSGLVGAEAALTIVFLILSALLMRTMVNLERIADFGFDPTHVLTARVTLPQSRDAASASTAFFDQVTEKLAQRPEIVVASAGMRVPAQGSRWNPNRSLQIQGRVLSADDPVWAQDLTVMPRYFAALGIALIEGRDFTRADAMAAQPVAIVSRTMANRYWPGRSPIGERVKIGDEDWRIIVGLVGDVRNDDIDAPTPPYLYVPFAQRPERTMTLVIRTRGNPAAATPMVREIVSGIDRNQPVYEIRTMERVLEDDLRQSWTLIEAIGMFAVCALLLATAGIYAVVAHAVSQRTQEIGVRMALGASLRDVVWMTVRQGLTPVVVGLTAGIGVAAAASQLLRSLLYGVTPLDPVAYLSTAGLLLALAVLAAVVPARRATRIDPLVALKQE